MLFQKNLGLFSKKLADSINRPLLSMNIINQFTSDQSDALLSPHYMFFISGFFKSLNIDTLCMFFEEGTFFKAEKKDFNNNGTEIYQMLSLKKKNADLEQAEHYFNTQGETVVKRLHKIDFMNAYQNINLLSSFQEYDGTMKEWYRNTKKNTLVMWHDSVEFDRGRGFFIPISMPILDQNYYFLGVSMLFLPHASFFSLIDVKDQNTHFYIMKKKGTLVYSSEFKQHYIIDANGRQEIVNVDHIKNDIIKQHIKLYMKKNMPDRMTFYDDDLDKPEVIHCEKIKSEYSTDWFFCFVFSKKEIIQFFYRNLYYFIAVFTGKLIFFLGLAFIVARQLNNWFLRVAVYIRSTASFRTSSMDSSSSFLHEIRNLKKVLSHLEMNFSIFNKILPKNIASAFYEKKLSLKGEPCMLSIGFIHIDNFSFLSKKTPSESIFYDLSEYFNSMTRVILNNHGTLDKYIGEKIMILWGAPIPQKDHAINACTTALMCAKLVMMEINTERYKRDRLPLILSFGLAAGHAIVGGVGSFDCLQYTALGNTVNMSSRLAALNKVYGTNILVNEVIYQQACNRFIFRPVDYVRVHGKEEPILVYELLAPFDEDTVYNMEDNIPFLSGENYNNYNYLEYVVISTQAWKAYQSREWQEARALYEKVEAFGKKDKIPKIFIERCDYYMISPPSPEWDGVFSGTISS